jgi:hypothetical protein
MGGNGTGKPKDAWDKWQIILSPVGGLLTALAVGCLTFYTSHALNNYQQKEQKAREDLQQIETNTRLYTELMSRREEAETGLRKEMFQSILTAFLAEKPAAESLDPEVLKLELLAYNFHESFNLSPLFKHLERKIEQRLKDKDPLGEEYLRRLRRVAGDIIAKQLSLLEKDGDSFVMPINFEDPPEHQSKTDTLTVQGIQREIVLSVVENDETTQEMKVTLHVRTLSRTPGPVAPAETPGSAAASGLEASDQTDAEFWVGSFEFPMIDNTRLSDDQRCAVVLRNYHTTSAQLLVVCFPGSRATLKERPYYDEVLEKLRQAVPH